MGEIQVRKATGTTRIYNISEAGSSRIFVGRQRPGGSDNKYGGLRYGTEAISGDEDLDLVNYSTGNVNFYTSAGTGSTTGGSFQFIDGDLNYVAASISKRGGLTLASPIVGTLVLDADGDATFGGSVSAASSITGSAVYTDTLEVIGTISAPGGIELTDPTFTGTVTATAAYIAGADPAVASNNGVKITSDGDIFANGGAISLGASASPVFTVTSIGDITGRSLTLTQGFNASSISVANLDVTSSLEGPAGFDLTSGGLSVDSINATSGDITTLTGTDISVTTVSADSFTAGSNVFSDSGLTVNNLNVSVLSGLSQLNGPIEITTSVESTTGIFGTVEASRVESNILRAGSGSEITAEDDLKVEGDVDVVDNVEVGGNIIMGDYQFRFSYDPADEELKVSIFDDQGDPLAVSSIPANAL